MANIEYQVIEITSVIYKYILVNQCLKQWYQSISFVCFQLDPNFQVFDILLRLGSFP